MHPSAALATIDAGISVTMNMPFRPFVASGLLLGLFVAMPMTASAADSDKNAAADAIDRIQLFDSLEDSGLSGRTLPSAMDKRSAKEIRQDQALYRSRQRMMRHEHNLWMGYEPTRPQWNHLPTMSSRYPRPTIYVPVYVR
jgi:hypothetical protein